MSAKIIRLNQTIEFVTQNLIKKNKYLVKTLSRHLKCLLRTLSNWFKTVISKTA